MKRVCAMCDSVVIEEPLCFYCDCGVSFTLTIVERYPAFLLVCPELPTRPTFEQAAHHHQPVIH